MYDYPVCLHSLRETGGSRAEVFDTVSGQPVPEGASGVTDCRTGGTQRDRGTTTRHTGLTASTYVTLLRKILLIWAEDVLFSEVSSFQGLK